MSNKKLSKIPDGICDYLDFDRTLNDVNNLFNDKLLLDVDDFGDGGFVCKNGYIKVCNGAESTEYNSFIRDMRNVVNELIMNYQVFRRLYDDFCSDPGIAFFKRNKKGEYIFVNKGIKEQYCLETIFNRYMFKYIGYQRFRISSFLMNTEMFADSLREVTLDEIEDSIFMSEELIKRLTTYEKNLAGFQIENSHLQTKNKENISQMIETIRTNIFENKKYKLDVKSNMYGKIINLMKTMHNISLNENKLLCEFVQKNSTIFIRKHNFNQSLPTLPAFYLELHKYFGNIHHLVYDYCMKNEILEVYDPSEDIDPYKNIRMD